MPNTGNRRTRFTSGVTHPSKDPNTFQPTRFGRKPLRQGIDNSEGRGGRSQARHSSRFGTGTTPNPKRIPNRKRPRQDVFRRAGMSM